MATTEEKTPEDRALSKRRVKVYKLNAAGAWDDTGTGYVEVKVIDVRRSYFSDLYLKL
jgi:hypothetical protein